MACWEEKSVMPVTWICSDDSIFISFHKWNRNVLTLQIDLVKQWTNNCNFQGIAAWSEPIRGSNWVRHSPTRQCTISAASTTRQTISICGRPASRSARCPVAWWVPCSAASSARLSAICALATVSGTKIPISRTLSRQVSHPYVLFLGNNQFSPFSYNCTLTWLTSSNSFTRPKTTT